MTRFRKGLIFAAVAGLGFAATALAGSGVGGVFNLGQTNTVNRASSLTGTTAGAQLKVINSSSTGIGVSGQSKSVTLPAVQGVNTSGGPALQATVSGNSVAPLKVNSNHVVPNLHAANSDELGGHPSTYFLGHTAPNAAELGGQPPFYYLPASAVQRVGPVSVNSCNDAVQTCNPAPLFVIGQLTVSDECLSNPNLMGEQDVTLWLGTSAAHAAFSDATTSGQTPTETQHDMQVGQLYTVADEANPTGGTGVFAAANGSALTADGHELFFSLYMGQNARGATGTCVFGGSIIVV